MMMLEIGGEVLEIFTLHEGLFIGDYVVVVDGGEDADFVDGVLYLFL
jgi:hypothetical protein